MGEARTSMGMGGPNMGDAGHSMGEENLQRIIMNLVCMTTTNILCIMTNIIWFTRSPRCVMPYHYFVRVKRDIV